MGFTLVYSLPRCHIGMLLSPPPPRTHLPRTSTMHAAPPGPSCNHHHACSFSGSPYHHYCSPTSSLFFSPMLVSTTSPGRLYTSGRKEVNSPLYTTTDEDECPLSHISPYPSHTSHPRTSPLSLITSSCTQLLYPDPPAPRMPRSYRP